MSRMREGMAHLARRMKERVGVPLAYTRGESTYTVSGWPSRSAASESSPTAGNGLLGVTEKEYLIPALDLLAAGVIGPPAEGDRITETFGSDQVTYELMASNGQPPWRWADEARAMYRVFCKPVGA